MRFLSIAASILFLAACTVGPTGLSACSTTPSAVSQTADEKALYVAEVAFAGAVAGVEAAVDSGALRGENATRASQLLAQARSALLAARQAYAANDAIGTLARAADVQDLIGQIGLLIPRRASD